MKVGAGTTIHPLTNIYCKSIGNNCTIANFVEIGKDVIIGNYCSIQAFSFIPSGVILGENVFVGPHVCFTNCRYPSANQKYETLEQGCFPYEMELTNIEDNVVIGAGSIILPGITIGHDSIIGAGSLIANTIQHNSKIIQKRCHCG